MYKYSIQKNTLDIIEYWPGEKSTIHTPSTESVTLAGDIFVLRSLTLPLRIVLSPYLSLCLSIACTPKYTDYKGNRRRANGFLLNENSQTTNKREKNQRHRKYIFWFVEHFVLTGENAARIKLPQRVGKREISEKSSAIALCKLLKNCMIEKCQHLEYRGEFNNIT